MTCQLNSSVTLNLYFCKVSLLSLVMFPSFSSSSCQHSNILISKNLYHCLTTSKLSYCGFYFLYFLVTYHSYKYICMNWRTKWVIGFYHSDQKNGLFSCVCEAPTWLHFCLFAEFLNLFPDSHQYFPLI